MNFRRYHYRAFSAIIISQINPILNLLNTISSAKREFGKADGEIQKSILNLADQRTRVTRRDWAAGHASEVGLYLAGLVGRAERARWDSQNL